MDRVSRLKVKAVIVVVACMVSALLLTFFLGTGSEERSRHLTSTIFELREEDGLPHFYFEEDYLFDRYLEESSTSMEELGRYLTEYVTVGKIPSGIQATQCSAFKVKKAMGDGFLTGRNFDYCYTEPAIVHTSPRGGYDSVSIVDMMSLGTKEQSLGERANETVYNALPYIPFDGINEKGVFVCVNMIGDSIPILQKDPDKPTIFIVSAIRLILDNASTTLEAIDLVMGYNLHTYANMHLFVCDNDGVSRCIEVINDETVITPTDIVTNHYVAEGGPEVDVTGDSRLRYDTIEAALEMNGTMTEEQAKSTLMAVEKTNVGSTSTRWSVVYDLKELCCVVWVATPYDESAGMDYTTAHRFSVHG